MSNVVKSPIASESFILTTEKGQKVNMRLDLVESSSFHYGNRTAVLMFEDGEFKTSFDTRYEKGCNTPESFHDWALSCVMGWVRPTIKVARA